MKLKPSEIRYSQDSISNEFSDINHGTIIDAFKKLLDGTLEVHVLGRVEVGHYLGNWVAFEGNRRLFIFKVCTCHWNEGMDRLRVFKCSCILIKWMGKWRPKFKPTPTRAFVLLPAPGVCMQYPYTGNYGSTLWFIYRYMYIYLKCSAFFIFF